MSYFSHHPEEYDEILIEAMTDFLSTGLHIDDDEREELKEKVREIYDDHAHNRITWEWLEKIMPLRFITNREADFWSTKADLAISAREAMEDR